MNLLEEFDRLAITSKEIDYLNPKELGERLQKRDDLIRRMSNEEIKELLSRNYVLQFKMKVVRMRKEI